MTSFKLSFKNIKKSFKDYSIYFITLIFGVCIFYIFNSIESQSIMLDLNSTKKELIQNMVEVISYLSIFISVILGFLIIYANNFLMKRRKKELGIYMTLGMSKRKISNLLLLETVFIGIISLAIGLLIGVFLSQGLSIFIANMFEANLSSFTFVFSTSALIKTCFYFGVIYILVSIFNVLTVSRYKLINLLNAHKKNEQIKVRNVFVTLILFILSIGCIGYAYYMLFNGALNFIDSKFFTMMLFGAVGTFLLFASISGFMLRFICLSKKIYLRNLNMFVLRQINSRINTTVISTTLITLMLLFTILILSTSISIGDSMNNDIAQNNLCDFTFRNIVVLDGTEKDKKENLSILDEFNKYGVKYSDYVSSHAEYNIYDTKQITLNDYLSKDAIDTLTKEVPMMPVKTKPLSLMKESEYNKIMDLFNLPKDKIDLAENEYIVACNVDKLAIPLSEALKNNTSIKLDGKDYKPKSKEYFDMGFQNSNFPSNTGIFILDDSAFNTTAITLTSNYFLGNYNINNSINTETLESDFSSYLNDFYTNINTKKPYEISFTKLELISSSVGVKALLIFVGLYIGVVFSITSAAVLAIGQLSEASDNKARYSILRKIGADEKLINRALFAQTGIIFGLPLAVALIHSFVGIKQVNNLLSTFAQMDLSKNILVTAIFLVVVYGGYFLATYLESRNIIKEND